jgi:hypothetical protein
LIKIEKFLYQNDQQKKLYKMEYGNKLSEAFPFFCGWPLREVSEKRPNSVVNGMTQPFKCVKKWLIHESKLASFLYHPGKISSFGQNTVEIDNSLFDR